MLAVVLVLFLTGGRKDRQGRVSIGGGVVDPWRWTEARRSGRQVVVGSL